MPHVGRRGHDAAGRLVVGVAQRAAHVEGVAARGADNARATVHHLAALGADAPRLLWVVHLERATQVFIQADSNIRCDDGEPRVQMAAELRGHAARFYVPQLHVAGRGSQKDAQAST